MLEKGSEETVGEKEIAFSTFGETPIARLGYSLVLGQIVLWATAKREPCEALGASAGSSSNWS